MKIITGNKKTSILDLEKSFILENLFKYGALQFNNFEACPESFSMFIKGLSSKVTSDPARKASTENTQLIEAGEMEMGLHLENGNAPFLPDLQFFYCQKAPKKKSRTTYCDGAKAFKKLSKQTANLLESRKIMYSRTIDEVKWKKYFSTELGISIDSLDQVLSHLPEDTQIFDHKNGKIEWRVRRYAVYSEPFSKFKVQAHCILAPSLNYDIPRITWSDGSIISPSVFSEVIESCESETHPFYLEDGDVIILNNHRFMHGREEIQDSKRIIYGGQSYL